VIHAETKNTDRSSLNSCSARNLLWMVVHVCLT
jgi:hypothetical protein